MRGAAATIMLAAALAACGGGDGETAPAGGEAATTSAAAPMDTTPAGTPAPPMTATLDSAAERTVVVQLAEYRVGLSRDTVSAGDVVFQIANAGSMPHVFELEGPGVEYETERLAAGASTTLAVSLRPGRYEIYCSIEENGVDHEDRGMRDTLVVM